jgi:xanthine phosphoribosyltransferase
LKQGDRVLIVDDFLANGKALIGLIDLCKQAGAEVVGCAIAIEKAFQKGGDELREQGIRIESLAKIGSMTDESLTFVD